MEAPLESIRRFFKVALGHSSYRSSPFFPPSLSLALSFFFSSSSLRPPPFHTRELQTPRVNIIALKLKAPTSSPHSLALVRLVALSHNLAQFDRYIGAVLCHG